MTSIEYEPNVVLTSEVFEVVGTRPIRPDGTDKVTGRALFGADFHVAGLLHGKVLRSPYAHAHIKSIDTSKAEVLPGVKAVVTAKDLPPARDKLMMVAGLPARLQWLRDNALASDKVLYQGHAVAGVAAVNPHVAEEALALIEVEYEVLPPVLSAPEAMKETAPLLHEDLRTTEFGEMGNVLSNVAFHFQHSLGDIERGFAEADIVFEREFNTSTVHQGYIEPQATTALWNNDGRVHIWCSTQGAFNVRDVLADIMGLPVSRIKVTPLELGGGFGGKIAPHLEPVAVLLSRKTGHPVKITMCRREVFQGTSPAAGTRITIKVGATNEGRITAAQANLLYEAGAFPGSRVGAGAMCVFACYDIPNVLIDGYDVVVNKPKSGPYRALGTTVASFASESVIDLIAEKLEMDPLELRLINAAREGTRRADGPVYPRIGCVQVIEAMRNHPHYSAPLEGENRGRGVSLGYWLNMGFKSSCTISVNSDGTVNLVEGSVDVSGSRVSIAMQAAEVLGIPAESVNPTVADTDSVGYTAYTVGSRTTFATGWAAYEAAQDVVGQMNARAALIWDVDPEAIELDRGVFKSKADPELKMTFQQLAGRLDESGGPVVGSATVDPGGVGGTFSGNIVDLEVDPETGKVAILRMTVVQDAGKAVHPDHVEGQMQGGSAQGIGWALHEEYYMNREGGMDNFSFLDYRMPTSRDLPMIDTVIVEVANPGHPFGVRGVAEASIVPPPAAIASAIRKSVGVRLHRLPMNPPAIMRAIWNIRP